MAVDFVEGNHLLFDNPKIKPIREANKLATKALHPDWVVPKNVKEYSENDSDMGDEEEEEGSEEEVPRSRRAKTKASRKLKESDSKEKEEKPRGRLAKVKAKEKLKDLEKAEEDERKTKTILLEISDSESELSGGKKGEVKAKNAMKESESEESDEESFDLGEALNRPLKKREPDSASEKDTVDGEGSEVLAASTFTSKKVELNAKTKKADELERGSEKGPP